MRVISYASRSLSSAEKNYHMHSGKLEFLAMKWTITEKFKDFLFYSNSFTVYTDNNPLSYVLTSAKLNATTMRWIAELEDYHFTIKYKPGKECSDADYLSRNSMNFEEYMNDCKEEVNPNVMSALMEGIENEEDKVICYIKSLETLTELESDTDELSSLNVSEAQRNDATIGKVKEFVENKVKPSKHEMRTFGKKMRTLVYQWSKLEIDENGILRRKAKFRNQIVLPECFKKLVYEELHAKMGHLGAEKVFELISVKILLA